MPAPARRDVLRFPAAVTPLTAALLEGPLTAGAVRACDELDLPVSGPRHRAEGPWVFVSEPGRAGGRELSEEDAAGVADRWRGRDLPAVEAAAARIDGLSFADPVADLPLLVDACEELWRRRWRGLHGATAAVRAFAGRHRAARPGVDELGAYGCLRGEPSRSLDADQALWEACQTAGSPGLLLALQAPTPEYAWTLLEATPDGLAWRDALLRTLAEHGRRSLLLDLSTPSWAEEAGFAMQVARRYGARPAREPRACAEAGRGEREREVAVARAGLAGEELAAYDRSFAWARAAYPLLRDVELHVDGAAFAAAVRPAVLRLGAALVTAGRLDEPDDVLFLDLGGLEAAAAGADARAAAMEGLERMAEAAGHDPAAPEPPGEPGHARGVPAAPGVAEGPARVIASLHELGGLRPGEVLVCRSATAAFSPLVPSIAGLVCETGDALAPGAVAAREYGVPAAMGARGALAAIPDDAPVRIDGAAGIVSLT